MCTYKPRKRDVMRGLVVAKKWARRANNKIGAEIKVRWLEDGKGILFYCEIRPNFKQKEVKRNFLALKWAYYGTKEELEVERSMKEHGL